MAAFAEGTPCWVDVSLPDLEAGKRFYGELFGWTFGQTGGIGAGRSVTAFSEGLRVAGLVAKKDGRMPTAWGVYFATADAVALSRRITAAGGALVRGPEADGRSGVIAQAADPAGAVFGIRQAGDDPGFERTGLPGSFCWTELYTRDKERVDPFYESVLGFRGTDLPGASIDFRRWSPAGAEPGEAGAIGGRSVITDAFPAEMPAHFLSYFAVADCDAAATTAVRLGGRVTAPPFDIPHGRMSVLLDNQGASFAVLSGAADPVAPEGPAAPEAAPEPE
ncbi:VOC family protein [Streptomyces sp. NPDC088258]|uniref:VOC family protein n=1 Tax=Streptomyces sp. NPDC088258 TaxID=3365849 RepID=UPI00381EA256